MFNKIVDAFARTRLGFVAAAAATALGVTLAFAISMATPIGDIGKAIDFSDPTTDFGALLVAVLLVALVIWGVAVSTHSTHSTNRFAK